MKKIPSLFLAVTIFTLAFAQDTSSKLIYADFEQLDKDKHAISARGGQIIFETSAQNAGNKPNIIPRMLGAQSPLTQRLGFEFELSKPNDWADASMKIVGLKDKGRLDDWEKTLIVKSEDLSQHKNLVMDIGAAGINQVRIRLISEGNGVDTGGAPPESFLNVTNELKTYKLPLSDFKQPSGDWVKKKVNTDQVLNKLTGIQISVVQVPAKGFLVVDNIIFEK